MPTRSKLLFTALAATAMMLTLVASASAGRFSFSEKEISILFRPLRFEAAGNNISCPLTLLPHFNERTISKVVRQVGSNGDVDPFTIASPPCTGGTVSVLTETFPWAINYASFSGTLPRITSVRLSLIGFSFRVSTGSLGCLAGTTATEPAFAELLVGTGGGITGLRTEENTRIRLGGSFLCSIAGTSTFSGSGTIVNLAQNRSITVTLI